MGLTEVRHDVNAVGTSETGAVMAHIHTSEFEILSGATASSILPRGMLAISFLFSLVFLPLVNILVSIIQSYPRSGVSPLAQ